MNETSVSQTDLSLIERMGDSRFRNDAWADFLDRYTRIFVNWFQRWGVDPHIMEDALQETLLRVLSDIRQFERLRHGSFRAWLKTLAYNSWFRLINDSERQLALGEIDPTRIPDLGLLRSKPAEDHLMQMLDDLATRELLSMAHSRVRRRVDPQTWQTYQRILIDQAPIEDVIASLHIPASQIYSTIFRVRRMLRDELNELDTPSA